ncbi:MAG: adaptor protein MecA [Clostridiales bacterium]|nr:adaptor protein MecA [Clostridiales bacterium]
MKIERVNENQIRCTLTRQDLAARQINLREFVYGSDKARGLFQDMIEQANYELGFEANDMPLMVEAIPLSSESLILLITKVEYPDELDTRFSQFSDPDEDMYPEAYSDGGVALADQKGADDILDMFKHLADGKSIDADEEPMPELCQDADLSDVTRMFEFNCLEEVRRLAHVLEGYYDGENDLYKDVRTNRFCLMVHKSYHTPMEFNRVCNMICEYATQKNYTSAVGAHYAEQEKRIIEGDALQKLAMLVD